MPDIRNIADSDLLVSWGRYLYWADLMYRRWDIYMTEKGAEASTPEWLGVSSYWFASLYVVIEGWETAKFNDPVVDALLKVSSYKDVLRRLRNGTFHYQPTIISSKVTDFFESGDVTLWIYVLHSEFCRWLRDCVEALDRAARLSPQQSQEWHETFTNLVGWVPLRLAEEEMKSLQKLVVDTTSELDASTNTDQDDSDAPKELRISLTDCDKAISETAKRVRQYRRDRLAQLGLNPDLVPSREGLDVCPPTDL